MSTRQANSGIDLVGLSLFALSGCENLAPHHLESLFKANTELSGIVGFLAALGTTYGAFPDLLAMLKRRKVRHESVPSMHVPETL